MQEKRENRWMPKHSFPRPLVAFGLMALFAAIPLANRCSASEAGKENVAVDAELNKVYKAVLDSIKDPETKKLFVQGQRAWLKYREDDVAFFAARYPGSKSGLFYDTDMMKARIAYFKLLLATPPSVDDAGPDTSAK